MGDAWKKVRAGQRLEIPAEAYNAFLDAARAERAQQHNIAQQPGDELATDGHRPDSQSDGQRPAALQCRGPAQSRD